MTNKMIHMDPFIGRKAGLGQLVGWLERGARVPVNKRGLRGAQGFGNRSKTLFGCMIFSTGGEWLLCT
jgi:hypothetical protein